MFTNDERSTICVQYLNLSITINAVTKYKKQQMVEKLKILLKYQKPLFFL